MTTGLLLLGWYIRGRIQFENPALKRSFKLVGMMVIIQVLLGVSTLLMQVPVWLAAMHQAGALLLFSAMLINLHTLRQF
jgi:cytochrome c oxidase assembly protein subunit 15